MPSLDDNKTLVGADKYIFGSPDTVKAFGELTKPKHSSHSSDYESVKELDHMPSLDDNKALVGADRYIFGNPDTVKAFG